MELLTWAVPLAPPGLAPGGSLRARPSGDLLFLSPPRGVVCEFLAGVVLPRHKPSPMFPTPAHTHLCLWLTQHPGVTETFQSCLDKALGSVCCRQELLSGDPGMSLVVSPRRRHHLRDRPSFTALPVCTVPHVHCSPVSGRAGCPSDHFPRDS